MAKAVFITPSKPDVTLTLTYEEAVTLRAITGVIGGSSSKTRRKHTDDIFEALVALGFNEAVSSLRRGDSLLFDAEEGI